MNFNGTPPKVNDTKPVWQSQLHSAGDGKAATARVTDFGGALKQAGDRYAGTDNGHGQGLNRLLNGGGSSIPPTYKRV